MEKTILTLKGYNLLKKEYENIKKEVRPAFIEEMKNAKENNNCAISENTEYLEAMQSLERAENKMNLLESKFSNARIIDKADIKNDGKVSFGKKIELINTSSEKVCFYTIVGEEEADIKKGFVSYKAPLAREMLNLEKGDYFECRDIEYEILSVHVMD